MQTPTKAENVKAAHLDLICQQAPHVGFLFCKKPVCVSIKYEFISYKELE